MSDDTIVCGKHGETAPTFMCRHLATGVACGYHASDEQPGNAWPDAWCDRCNDDYVADDGWTEESEARADIKVLCTHCYERQRDRNRVVPDLARGDHEALIEHACRDAQARQDRSHARIPWREHARWDADLDAGRITFSDPALPTVIADIRLVGTYALASGTFQWGWAAHDLDDAIIDGIWELQAFGEIRGLDKLTESIWECPESEAWHMANLAAYLLDAEAVYRAPFGEVHCFLLLDRLRTPS